jgi:hypothetical protein
LEIPIGFVDPNEKTLAPRIASPPPPCKPQEATSHLVAFGEFSSNTRPLLPRHARVIYRLEEFWKVVTEYVHLNFNRHRWTVAPFESDEHVPDKSKLVLYTIHRSHQLIKRLPTSRHPKDASGGTLGFRLIS